MLRRESIVHVESHQVPIHGMDDSLAEVMIIGQSSKDPASSVEVDVRGPLLRVTVIVVDWSRFEDPDPDVSSFDRT